MKASLIALTILLTFTAASAQTITLKRSRYGPVSEGHFKGADGVRLFYRKVGQGKNTVVFLHGGPGLGIGDGGYDMEPLARNRVLLMYDQMVGLLLGMIVTRQKPARQQGLGF